MPELHPAVDGESLTPLPDGVPEVLPDDLPREYETDRLLIKATEEETLRFEDWFPECPSLWYEVFTKDDGRYIADLGIYYDYASKLIFIDNIGIVSEREKGDFGKGYGLEMYMAVPTMALPDGRYPEEAGFTFATEHHSDEAERVWQSLERRGLVENVGARAYMWTVGKSK